MKGSSPVAAFSVSHGISFLSFYRKNKITKNTGYPDKLASCSCEKIAIKKLHCSTVRYITCGWQLYWFCSTRFYGLYLIIKHAKHGAAPPNPVVFRLRTWDAQWRHEVGGMSRGRQRPGLWISSLQGGQARTEYDVVNILVLAKSKRTVKVPP